MPKSKEFQYLVELIDIVNRHKVKQIEVIGNPKSSHIPMSRYWEFYEQMVDGNFKNDQDAILFFALENKERSYKKLRSGLQERLLNTLFFIDTGNNHLDEYLKGNYDLFKKFTAFQILRSRGSMALSTKLAKDILKQALKYHNTELIYSMALFIRDACALDSNKRAEYEKYNDLMWLQFDTRREELKALEYYNRIIMPYISESTSKPQLTKKMKSYVQELEEVPKTYQSEKFLRILFILRIYIPLNQCQWKKTIKEANKAIDYYQENPQFPKRIISVFMLQRILAKTMLHQYKQARVDIRQAEQYTPTHSRAWFKLKELEASSFFYEGVNLNAYQLVKTILKHPRFKSLAQSNKETWYIYNAYISFLQLIGQIELSPREKGALKKFRLSKFLNEVPLFSRDYQGMNISILIVQILILLQQENYDDLDFKIESLMKYKKRKLSDISNRTGFFLKMIQCLKRGNYRKDLVVHKATPYFEKLQKIEFDMSNQAVEFEVIPYPRLWGYVIDLL